MADSALRRHRLRKRAYRARMWRAVAYIPDPTAPNGRRREVAGRTAAVTLDGLSRFIREHEARGHAVDVSRLTSIEDFL